MKSTVLQQIQQNMKMINGYSNYFVYVLYPFTCKKLAIKLYFKPSVSIKQQGCTSNTHDFVKVWVLTQQTYHSIET